MSFPHRWSRSWLAKATRRIGESLAGLGVLTLAAVLTAGCLDRPITPATPSTSNVYISQIRQTGVDKIDLLFMIDNSISMADKQQILAQAVPVLVQRLITPTCVDANGVPVTPAASADGTTGQCPAGRGAPEFKPIKNIHIGIITSSIGDHGSGDVCSIAAAAGDATLTYDDKAQLLATVRTGLTSWNNSGFLVWDPRSPADAPDLHPNLTMNETNATAFVQAFSNQVTAAGEHGCGYEASLESWYRFLVDDQPVDTMSHDGTTGVSIRGPVNQAVLAQRRAFLRPDSLLAIIMLSDENDCSIVDENGSQGWLVPYKGGVMNNNWRMPRAKQICGTSPNDPSCGPCVPGTESDPSCAAGLNLSVAEDSMNERCFNQVRRFGVNLLYPIQRYVDALTQTVVYPRLDNTPVTNPIFAGANGAPGRDPGLVFLAGIVGVPWQDVATDASLQGRNLQYMTADELATATPNRWDVILGPLGGTPLDPFMIESIDPRQTGMAHPFVAGAAIAAPDSTNPAANAINGHEQQVIPNERADLQFACIFPLSMATPCTQANEGGCDCNADEFAKNSPLCNYPAPMMDGTQQRAKAYPGVRELQVLKGFGSNAIVASICPKNIDAMGGSPQADPAYGYNPAVGAIVERLKEALTAKCLPRPLIPEVDPASPDVGKVPCAVVEVKPQPRDANMQLLACPACENAMTPGRSTLAGEKAKIIPAVKEDLSNHGQCGAAGLPSCNEWCMCEIQQFTDMDLERCQTEPADPGGLYGYCYVDPAASILAGATQAHIMAEQALVANCQQTQQRILRFLGTNLPAKDGLAFIACIGAAAQQIQ